MCRNYISSFFYSFIIVVIIFMLVSVGNEEMEEFGIDSDILLKRNVNDETRLAVGHQVLSSARNSIRKSLSTPSHTAPKCNAMLRNKVTIMLLLRFKS